MSTEEIVIAAVRVAGSLLVLRWPFWGGVTAVLVDLSDLFLMNLLDLGGVASYQSFDKWLDQVYMACFLVVALRWPHPQRSIAMALYAIRLAGFVAFEATGAREVLVLFPNVFEFWFLFVAAAMQWAPPGQPVAAGADRAVPVPRSAPAAGTGFEFTPRASALVLLTLLAVKEAQEVAIHWLKLLDSFTAVEAVEAIWDFLMPPY